jgi:hypothetical protein
VAITPRTAATPVKTTILRMDGLHSSAQPHHAVGHDGRLPEWG